MPTVFYSIKAPENVKEISAQFKRKLKVKTKLEPKVTLKNAEKKKKDSDVVLFFFPVVSRTGTDIDAAINNIKEPNDKPVILVVLHHTFDPEAVVSDSKKFVQRENTCTVDCLFYEDKGLLECKLNDEAFTNAIKFLKSISKKKQHKQKGSSTNTDQLRG